MDRLNLTDDPASFRYRPESQGAYDLDARQLLLLAWPVGPKTSIQIHAEPSGEPQDWYAVHFALPAQTPIRGYRQR